MLTLEYCILGCPKKQENNRVEIIFRLLKLTYICNMYRGVLKQMKPYKVLVRYHHFNIIVYSKNISNIEDLNEIIGTDLI